MAIAHRMKKIFVKTRFDLTMAYIIFTIIMIILLLLAPYAIQAIINLLDEEM
jgi:hypothetical protein